MVTRPSLVVMEASRHQRILFGASVTVKQMHLSKKVTTEVIDKQWLLMWALYSAAEHNTSSQYAGNLFPKRKFRKFVQLWGCIQSDNKALGSFHSESETGRMKLPWHFWIVLHPLSFYSQIAWVNELWKGPSLSNIIEFPSLNKTLVARWLEENLYLWLQVFFEIKGQVYEFMWKTANATFSMHVVTFLGVWGLLQIIICSRINCFPWLTTQS